MDVEAVAAGEQQDILLGQNRAQELRDLEAEVAQVCVCLCLCV